MNNATRWNPGKTASTDALASQFHILSHINIQNNFIPKKVLE